jgi:Uma2 family endonuclease
MQVKILTEADELVAEEILPGFRLKLSEIFTTPFDSKST